MSDKKETTQEQQDVILLTRRQRRFMLKQRGVMNIISKMNFLGPERSELRRQNMENGRKLHQSHLDVLEQRNAEALEQRLESLKETWSSLGYNAEEVSLLEEAWALTAIKDKETYRADKKKARALRKQAEESKASRK